MAAFEQLSGLAGEIRASITSEQFDLAGYTEPRVKELLHQAFSEPLEAPTEMVKFTFVVGGGKLVRSRYSDDMTKWATNALREIGFSDDRSAAVDYSSQGTYKQQHDTGQNLKYLVVFPHVKCASQGNSADASADAASVGPNTSSKEYIVTACEFSTFGEIVSSKTQSWSQRKRLLKILQDAKTEFDGLEQRLIQGSPLSPGEQAIYDANSGCDAEKISWLQGEIKGMVDNGKLTADEKAQLIESLSANIEAVDAEIEQSRAEGKDKRVEKLEEKKSAIQTRLAAVRGCNPVRHRLKKGDEIQKAVVALQPLYALEEKGRAMALTLADLRTLESKDELEQRVAQLEAASRCWFESDEEFEERCVYEREQGKAKFEATKKKMGGTKKKAVGGGAASGTQGRMATKGSSYSSSSMSNQWASIGKKKPSSGASRPAPKPSGGGGNGFAAAFGGDDSSDEDSS